MKWENKNPSVSCAALSMYIKTNCNEWKGKKYWEYFPKVLIEIAPTMNKNPKRDQNGNICEKCFDYSKKIKTSLIGKEISKVHNFLYNIIRNGNVMEREVIFHRKNNRRVSFNFSCKTSETRWGSIPKGDYVIYDDAYIAQVISATDTSITALTMNGTLVKLNSGVKHLESAGIFINLVDGDNKCSNPVPILKRGKKGMDVCDIGLEFLDFFDGTKVANTLCSFDNFNTIKSQTGNNGSSQFGNDDDDPVDDTDSHSAPPPPPPPKNESSSSAAKNAEEEFGF